MKVEFLISTMNRTSLDFLSDMFRQVPIEEVNATIINQCTTITPPSSIDTPSSNIKVISFAEKGLAKSRNRAINAATGDICVTTDDDCVYLDTCIEIIAGAYSNICGADMITFRSLSSATGLPRKPVSSGVCRHNQFSIFGVSSIEITFLRSSVLEKSLLFDERFGLGSRHPVGEENIFLKDCIDAGLSLYSYPASITTTDAYSTGYQMIGNPELRGKVFRRIYKNNMMFLFSIIYSSVRKYPIYKHKMGLFTYINKMWIGARDT